MSVENEIKTDRIDKEEWSAHVKKAIAYNGSDAAYCRKNSLNKNRFSYHKKKYMDEQLQESPFIKLKAAELPRETSKKTTLPEARWVAELIRFLWK